MFLSLRTRGWGGGGRSFLPKTFLLSEASQPSRLHLVEAATAAEASKQPKPASSLSKETCWGEEGRCASPWRRRALVGLSPWCHHRKALWPLQTAP